VFGDSEALGGSESEDFRRKHDMSTDARETPPINPNAMPVDVAAKVLARLSPGITEAMLQADVAAGAPTNPDGSLNLVHYAAWLVREAGA
jgi:hypothetical protein